MDETSLDYDDRFGNTAPNNMPDADEASPGPRPTLAGDGLPGFPVEGHPGWRVGVFGPGRNLLDMIRVSDLVGRRQSAPSAMLEFGIDTGSSVGAADPHLMKTSQGASQRGEPIGAPPGVSSQSLVDQTRQDRDKFNRLGEQADLTPGQDAPVGTALRAQPLLDWIWKVRPGGEWDFKRLDKSGQPENRYEGFGNYNYMRTGHEGLGIGEETLRRAAGFMQEVGGLSRGIDHLLHLRPWGTTGYDPAWGHFWQSSPYGDDPADQAAMPTYPRKNK